MSLNTKEELLFAQKIFLCLSSVRQRFRGSNLLKYRLPTSPPLLMQEM